MVAAERPAGSSRINYTRYRRVRKGAGVFAIRGLCVTLLRRGVELHRRAKQIVQLLRGACLFARASNNILSGCLGTSRRMPRHQRWPNEEENEMAVNCENGANPNPASKAEPPPIERKEVFLKHDSRWVDIDGV